MSDFISSLFQKATTSVSSQVQSVVGGLLNDASSELADALFKIGHGFDSIVSMSSLQSDSLVSGGSPFFATGTSIAQQISSNRSPDGAAATNPAMVMNNTNVSVLQFPPDMGEFSIKFDFKDYKRPDPLQKATYQTTASVLLPIPSDLNETHLVGWNSAETGLVGALADLIQPHMSGGNITTDSLKSAIAGTSGQALKALASRFGLKFLDELSVDTASQFLGAIPNPNIAMFFEGPTFQTQTFKWTFHPTSPAESDTIRAIVNIFRQKMLPSFAQAGGSNVLNYPSMVEVSLQPDLYLYKMKRMIVESINVSYAPRGFPTFFKGTKAPTFIEFQVNLKAIEYFLSEDFGGHSGNANLDSFSNSLSTITNSLQSTLGLGGNG